MNARKRTRPRTLSHLTVALVMALAGAATANAAVFSVAAPGTPGANDTACTPCATIQGGVVKAAAAAGPDEVMVAAGTFVENVTIAPGNDVTVTSAGAGATTLDGGAATVALTMDHPATVRRLRVIGTAGRIVDLNGGTLAEATVERPTAATAGIIAINMGTGAGSAVLRDSIVRMPPAPIANYGVTVDTTVGEPQILRSAVEAGYAIDVGSPRPVLITHSTVKGNIYGVFADNPATSVTISNSLVVAGTVVPATGTGVSKRVGSSATVSVRGCTIIGNGGTTGIAAESNAFVGGAVNVVDTILWGHRYDVERFAAVGGNPTISLTRTLYDPARVDLSGPGVFDASGGGNLTGVAPGFVSELTADFRLLATSPAVDAGTPGPLAPGEATTDILGELRLADGNGDGVFRRDIGAFERPTPPPPLPGTAPPPPAPGPAPLPPPPASPLLVMGKPPAIVRSRVLRLRITGEAAGRLVLLARNPAGRVVGRLVVPRLRAGSSTVILRLSNASRSGPLVLVATLTPPGARASKDVQFTRLALPTRK